MKLSTHLFTIPIASMLLSCNNASTHKEQKELNKFEWSIGAVLPHDADNHPSAGLAGPVVGISNNVLILGGGSNFPGTPPWKGGEKKYYAELYLYSKLGDSLHLIKTDLKLPENIAYSANCSTDKGIVVAGGENQSGATSQVLLLQWDAATQKMNISNLPNLPQALSAGAIVADKNKVYFAGGQNSLEVSDQLYMLDLNDTTKGWQTLPSLNQPTAYSTLYMASNGENNCLYLVGGRKINIDSTSDLYAQVYQYNLNTRKWTQKAPMPFALSAQTGVSFGDHQLLVFSGDRGKTFHKTENLLMQIGKENDLGKKDLLIKEKNIMQENHPGFTRDVLVYNTLKDSWETLDSTAFPGQVTTTALFWGGEVIIPCGEIRAGVRSANIIMGKIKTKGS